MDNEKFQEQVLSRFEQISRKLEQNDKFQEHVLDRFEQVFEHLKLLSDSVDILAVNQERTQLDIATLKEDVTTLKEDVTNVRQSQVRIEQDHSRKITALFDFRDTQLKVNKTFSED